MSEVIYMEFSTGKLRNGDRVLSMRPKNKKGLLVVIRANREVWPLPLVTQMLEQLILTFKTADASNPGEAMRVFNRRNALRDTFNGRGSRRR
jgi:hypothetical protein